MAKVREDKKKEAYAQRSFRIEDDVYKFFVSLKPRDKSWSLFFKELTEIIKYFKQL